MLILIICLKGSRRSDIPVSIDVPTSLAEEQPISKKDESDLIAIRAATIVASSSRGSKIEHGVPAFEGDTPRRWVRSIAQSDSVHDYSPNDIRIISESIEAAGGAQEFLDQLEAFQEADTPPTEPA